MSDLGETQAPGSAEPITGRIADVFASAGARGFLHAREVGVPDGPEVAVDADEPVVLASVFKIAVAVTYPDGRQYALAVFTRAVTLSERQPAVDSSIGRAARLAVDHLRAIAGTAVRPDD